MINSSNKYLEDQMRIPGELSTDTGKVVHTDGTTRRLLLLTFT
jgi:hypothetical protein